MAKYFKSRSMEQYNIWHSALRYAKWHCRVGKLSPNSHLILDDLVEPLNNALKKNDWKPVYRQEPIKIPELEKLENGKPPSSGIYTTHHRGTEYIESE